MHIITNYSFLEWEMNPKSGPFIYLPPARSVIQQKFGYLPAKMKLIADFEKKEAEVAGIEKNEYNKSKHDFKLDSADSAERSRTSSTT